MSTAERPSLTSPPSSITGAEFRIGYESMGLSAEWMASHLGVNVRTVKRWGYGHSPVPLGVVVQIEVLEQYAIRAADDIVDELQTGDGPREVIAYRSDDDYRASGEDDSTMPAAWHRAMLGRVMDMLPDVRVRYSDESLR